MKKVFFYLAFLATLCGQDASIRRYTATRESTLAGAAEVFTVIRASGNNRSAEMLGASVYCSVACTVTVENTGVFTSGTAITPKPLRSTWGAATMQAYYATSITAVNILSTSYVPAGGTLILDLTGIYLTETGDNVTFRTNAITGTVGTTVKWMERN